jgi:hemoglobin
VQQASKSPRGTYVPGMNPAEIAGPSRDVYARMGQSNIDKMLEDFYRELGASPIRSMFSTDLVAASRRSALFFAQVLGGPQEYTDRFGPPRMRARHMAFRITPQARAIWLECFERVLDRAVESYGFPAEHLEGFRTFLRQFSLWMVNTEDDV